ncbi:DUF2807 domain-containing protein [Myroides sp. JBRI-B21084]|uniref:GIN domain-containing protein n=1 Tax=Myroides sp. JBRI-B21084 TaxID=3119977 RepID=UPI0026E2EA93|nr:DUF2807 domain-containing protein [Paenimyroides cloacae]WKW46473.1 DUF2807 domain-containing protein [Paenimyroides cloacae]
MKKLLLLTFISICTASCTKKIELSGEIVSQKVQVSKYTALSNNTIANIELDSAVPPNTIQITGDKALIENLGITTQGGSLNISNKQDLSIQSNKAPVTIKINNPQLQKIVIAGTGSLVTNNVTLVNDVEFHVSGTGDISVKLFNNSSTVFATGTGDVRLRGISTELKAHISGTGSLFAQSLNNKLANIEITGNGDARMNTTDELNIKISGVGNVSYKKYTDLKVFQKISGIGSVNPY